MNKPVEDELTSDDGEMPPANTSSTLDPADYGFGLLREVGPVLVLNKPPGVLTQGPPGTDSLELRLRRFLKARDNPPGKQYVVPVHRLDRPASGAILFVRNIRAAKRLGRQFEDRTVTKIYHALVEGHVAHDVDTWTDSMRKVPEQPRSEMVSHDHSDAQIAILGHRVILRTATMTLLEIQLGTGRTHQIRLQCSHRGHPIVGDEQYGSTLSFGDRLDDERARPIALHAARLAFDDPRDKTRVEFAAPHPSVWEAYIPPQSLRSERPKPAP